MEFSKELIAKARACKTEEELKALAKENGIEIPDEEIKLFIAENAEGELAEEELEAVSGGQKGCKRNAYEEVYFETEEEVEYLFNIGDVTEAFIGKIFGNETATVKITKRSTALDNQRDNKCWKDVYKYDRIDGSPTHWGFGWQPRSRFEK